MIQRYVNLMGIDAGGYGSVYKAYDTRRNREVAIKLLNDKSPENLKLFRREVCEMRKPGILNNAHAVQILDDELNNENPYFVMEFCSGGNITSEIGKTGPQAAIIILKSMLIALKAVHKDGGFHGDIKPHNILIAKSGKAKIYKLADFGLAHMPNLGSAMTHTPRGTDQYKAPEVRKRLSYTSSADIYSLGITIFELMTGSTEIPYLFLTPGPMSLTDLLREMTADDPRMRPNLAEIRSKLTQIEKDLYSKGATGLLSKLSYPGMVVGCIGLAFILAGLTSGGKA